LPDPSWGVYRLDLRGLTSKGKEWRRREGGRERKEKGEAREIGGEGVDIAWPRPLALRDASAAASGPIWS